MNLFKLSTLFITATLLFIHTRGQNVSLNILTQNAGQVGAGSTVAVEMTVCNTDGAVSLANYRIRPRLTVPAALVSIPATGHTLPPGWTILTNTGTIITLSNGTDIIPAGECRTVLIRVQGNTIGGPSTVNGSILFANGVAPGTTTGSATPGDVSSDNTSTSTVQVINSVPLNLLSFAAAFDNCNTVLSWRTANEQNTGHFEIERAASSNASVWTAAGRVTAAGNSGSERIYAYTDAPGATAGKWLYRLKMVDLNGRYTYSQVLPVAGTCNEAAVLIYPNPVQDGKLFVTASGVGQQATGVLTSTDGRVVYSGKIVNGTNIISTASFAGGTYMLTVRDENGTAIHDKVIVR